MINEKELRIGNLVIDYEKTTHSVCGIKNNIIYSWWLINSVPLIKMMPKDAGGVLEEDPYIEHVGYYNPIPLTEDWLIKFGFELNHWETENRDQKTMCLDGQSIEVWENSSFYMSEIDLFIKSVHQLQNLYFALTGEELNIKP